MDSESTLFEIVIGTYGNPLLGYFFQLRSDEFCLKPSFVSESHSQSVRCLAHSGKFLASGSADETIQLLNVKSRHELGSLVHHNGTITSLEFFDSFLMSSSEDKSICVWSTSNWECLKTLCGHKKAVNCVSIHPSGKMALSVSKDKTLRTWDLVKGRTAFVTNLSKEGELVKWSPDGCYFLVVAGNSMDVYCTKNASVLRTTVFKHKICDLTFLQDSVCAVVGESENISLYNVATGSIQNEVKAHKCRIKAIKCISVNEDLFLASASSDGIIKVWFVDRDSLEIKKISKVKTGSRPTCMTLIPA